MKNFHYMFVAMLAVAALPTCLPVAASAQVASPDTVAAQAAASDTTALAAADARQAWVDAYRWIGGGLSVSFPYTDFGDEVNTGYGVHVLVDRPVFPMLNLSADVGLTRFSGDDERGDLTVWNVIVGGRLLFGVLFMGGEGGYLTEVDSFGFVPSFGLRFERLEFTVRHVTAGADAWTTLRAGYYF